MTDMEPTRIFQVGVMSQSVRLWQYRQIKSLWPPDMPSFGFVHTSVHMDELSQADFRSPQCMEHTIASYDLIGIIGVPECT